MEKLQRIAAQDQRNRILILPIIFLIALLWHSNLAPFEETHWDAPIYVLLAKYAAETNLLQQYHQLAADIQLGPGDNAHWYFTRIGHVLLLGEVVKLLGNDETALVAMQWLYRLLMAFSVLLCIILTKQLGKFLRVEKVDFTWWAASLIVAMSYIASDGFRGLQGHLTSEPPAFFVMVLFACVLLRAVEKASLANGVFAGVLLFLLFFIRIDAVLPGLIFLLILLAVVLRAKKFSAIPTMILAGVVSLALYVLYAWWFSPLVNPLTLLNFSAEAKGMFPGLMTKSLFAILIAGGLLWVGAGTCLIMPTLWRDPLVIFAVIWLGLSLFPMLIDSFYGRSIQARMAFFSAAPLLILATEGWRQILREFIEYKKFNLLLMTSGLMVMLALIPHAFIREESRNFVVNYLPSEIQKYFFISPPESETLKITPHDEDARLGLMVRPVYERWTLEYSKAQQLADHLYYPSRPVYLLWPMEKLPGQHSLQNYIRLIRFFGRPYPEGTRLPLTQLPNTTDDEPCAHHRPTELEPVIFCSNIDSSFLEKLKKEEIDVYILSADQYPMPEIPAAELDVVWSAAPFVLYRVAE